MKLQSRTGFSSQCDFVSTLLNVIVASSDDQHLLIKKAQHQNLRFVLVLVADSRKPVHQGVSKPAGSTANYKFDFTTAKETKHASARPT